MAPTPDQRVAKDQLKQLRMLKQRLQDEKNALQAAGTRIPDINAEIAAINAEIDIIKVRDPDDGLPAVVPLQAGSSKPKV